MARARTDDVVTVYGLYLDHGPKRRKTMVHVIDLMGCVANGPTTDEVLEATPDAIREFLTFLGAHGDPVDPSDTFGVRIVEEVTEGQWLGNGIAVFGPDRDRVAPKEVGQLLQRHRWIRDDTLALVAGLTPRALEAKPEKGRSVADILRHVLAADGGYLASGLASNRALNRLARDAEAGSIDVGRSAR